MRVLFIGDIVGANGVDFVKKSLPVLIAREGLDLVVANAENAANGSGITPSQFRQLRTAGVDLITLGDHIYKKMDIATILQTDERVCKPANYPEEAPGRMFALAPARDGTLVAVFTLMGRTFMRPVDCPFRAADRVLKDLEGKTKCIIVDMHAEATADKYLMARHLDGRVSAVLGTHTHVPTADEQILKGGTAFQCDVGMTGPYDGVLGRRADKVLSTAVSFIPTPFDVATEDLRLGGAIVDVDPTTGKATGIRRFMFRECELTT